MNTTKPNTPFGQPTQAGSNKGKSQGNFAQQAAAAGIGAVGGGVAGWAANSAFDPDPEPVPENNEDQQAQEQQTAPSSTASSAGSHAAAQQPSQGVSGQQAANAISGNNTPETPATPPAETTTPATPATPATTTEQEINPDDIEIQVEEIDMSTDEETDVILAEEQIDPTDINAGDKVVFDNVGTVYTLDGEAYSAATFHFEGDEEQFVMVDVDGDEVFDIITDENFTVEVETPYDFSYGDAEQQLSAEDPNYLAAAGTEVEMPDDIDFTDDIITT